jgi:beta-glucanase (GH16 family)
MNRQLSIFFKCAVVLCAVSTGCGAGNSSSGGGTQASTQTPAPAIGTAAALNGAQIVTLTDSTPGATIYYSIDGSAPTTGSPQYLAPFLIASNVTLNAVAMAPGDTTSSVAAQTFAPNLASGTLVWSDEFTNNTSSNAEPNAAVWTYDTGAGGWGNSELEDYCAWGSNASPCNSSNPNAYVGTDGYLHITAISPSSGIYTSARMKTEGLFSLNYGRVEARILLPEGQGFWPAFWMLGNNIATVNWPACGEQDVMEHIDAPSPDWIAGSLHGTNANLTQQYGTTVAGFSGASWHTYGMIWTKGSIQFYVDSPSNVYATFTPSSLAGQSGAVWPFDSGSGAFIILNLAVGGPGSWPGAPNSTTSFPAQMLVDYVRIYSN